MTWTKVSDDFSDDCWSLSDGAFRLHVEGLVWSNRKLLDLKIPKADLARFAKDPEAVTELIGCGWWTDDADHYTIRHHATYQRTREAVLKQQAANIANRAKRGKSAPPSRERANESLDHSLHESLNGSTNERDRTGQVKDCTYEDNNLCAHGVVDGDVWQDGHLACDDCAELTEVAS